MAFPRLRYMPTMSPRVNPISARAKRGNPRRVPRGVTSTDIAVQHTPVIAPTISVAWRPRLRSGRAWRRRWSPPTERGCDGALGLGCSDGLRRRLHLRGGLSVKPRQAGDDLVAARQLGSVERLIGRLEQDHSLGAIVRGGRDANRDGEMPGLPRSQRNDGRLRALPNPLRNLHRRVDGLAGQEDCEFLTAVARRDVLVAYA